MATYLMLNLVYMAVVLVTLKLLGVWGWNSTMTILLVMLIILTAVFDSLIISAGIVDYDPAKILGLKIGLAPIEDFVYSLVVVVLIPAIWNKLEASRA